VLNNNKMMLVFGLVKEEKELLDSIIEKENLPKYKIINNEMASMKIRDIIDDLRFEIYGETLPEEKAILFNNFTDDELNRAIAAIRGNMEARPILAVITPTSIEWSFKYLLEHLIEEREWHRANQKRGM
jgi:hypothetical protein